jgi:hypothetical protein
MAGYFQSCRHCHFVVGWQNGIYSASTMGFDSEYYPGGSSVTPPRRRIAINGTYCASTVICFALTVISLERLGMD